MCQTSSCFLTIMLILSAAPGDAHSVIITVQSREPYTTRTGQPETPRTASLLSYSFAPCFLVAGFIRPLVIAETVLLYCWKQREVNDGVREIVTQARERRNKGAGFTRITISDLSLSPGITECDDRGPNLAVFFLV